MAGFTIKIDAAVSRANLTVLLDRRHNGRIVEARTLDPVVPMRKTRRLYVAADRWLEKLRNLVKRCFNKPKNAGRIATRYDETAESFLDFIDIRAIRPWPRH